LGVLLTLISLLHLISGVMYIINPHQLIENFNASYDSSLSRLASHFGLFSIYAGLFQMIAAIWVFKRKQEGILLGIANGVFLLLISLFDIAVFGAHNEIFIPIGMGVLVLGAAFWAKRSK